MKGSMEHISNWEKASKPLRDPSPKVTFKKNKSGSLVANVSSAVKRILGSDRVIVLFKENKAALVADPSGEFSIKNLTLATSPFKERWGEVTGKLHVQEAEFDGKKAVVLEKPAA